MAEHIAREVCQFCYRPFKTQKGLRIHQENTLNCRESRTREQDQQDLTDRLLYLSRPQPEEAVPNGDSSSVSNLTFPQPSEGSESTAGKPTEFGLAPGPSVRSGGATWTIRQPASIVQVAGSDPDLHDDFEELLAGVDGASAGDDDDPEGTDDAKNQDQDAIELETLDDNDMSDTSYPSQAEVDGATLSAGVGGSTTFQRFTHEGAAKLFQLDDLDTSDTPVVSEFEKLRQKEDSRRPYHPFSSRAEWGLAKWLSMSGLTKSVIDGFLKLEWVSTLSVDIAGWCPTHNCMTATGQFTPRSTNIPNSRPTTRVHPKEASPASKIRRMKSHSHRHTE